LPVLLILYFEDTSFLWYYDYIDEKAVGIQEVLCVNTGGININMSEIINNNKKSLDICIMIEEGTKELIKGTLNAKKVILPSSLETIDARVFGKSVEEIEIWENNVYCIVDGALLTKDNKLVFLPKHCEIPDCVEVIMPFSCRLLETEELVLPKNIKEIQYMGFAGSKIVSVICDEKLRKIGSYAFDSLNLDTGLQSIQLNDGLIDIGDNAFKGTLLTEIFIPKTVENIGLSLFDVRGKLKKIEVDARNIKYYSNGSNSIIEKGTDKLLVGCKKTLIPENVKEIAENAFYSCGLSKINLPNSLCTIGDYCFASNKLENVDLNMVLSVGSGAFENNADLQGVIFSKKMKSVPSYLVSGCDNLKTVELPNDVELIQTDAFSNFLGDKIIINKDVKEIKERAFSSYHAQIIYKGTKQEWLDIVGSRNVCYYDYGKPKQPQKYTVECIDGQLSVPVFTD